MAARSASCSDGWVNVSSLWQWSVDEPEAFLQALWDHFDVIHDGELAEVRTQDPMPRTRWFTGTRLNYAEHVLRNETNGDPPRTLLHHSSKLRDLDTMNWAEVAGAVRRLATKLRDIGPGPGDRVVAYMPNIPETVIAMLATTAIGAVWSSAAPEFGARTVKDRLGQIEPKPVFAANGYRFGGKDYDRIDDLKRNLATLPTADCLVMLNYHPETRNAPEFHGETLTWGDIMAGPDVPAADFDYERVPSDHPLWVLFSSGTTGLPKPIVQGHHGILLEHLKSAAFHFETPEVDALFFYSTTGWMVWSTLMWGPLMTGRAVLCDGHPAYPDAGLLWRIADETRTTSQSGGTEFCSGILAGSPLLPTRAGEIQAPGLATDVVAMDAAGNVIIFEVGELALRSPMLSMPLFFRGDGGYARYKASYFDTYPGLWRHGDRVKFNAHGGSFVLGRSDATLDRFGVRIGWAEKYQTLETFPRVASRDATRNPSALNWFADFALKRRTMIIASLFDLSGKTALVTGAAQGLGQVMALAEARARVAVIDRDGDGMAIPRRGFGRLVPNHWFLPQMSFEPEPHRSGTWSCTPDRIQHRTCPFSRPSPPSLMPPKGR